MPKIIAKKLLSIIAEELIVMVRVDQEMRNKWMDARSEGKEDLFYFDPDIDKKNSARLKDIIDLIGWPTIPLVGEEASKNAWILAQHADHDHEFQKKCLELMINTPEGEISKRNIAYLTDRVAVQENHPQTYGTQFANAENGKVKIGKVIDPKNLDKRRKEAGLEPIAEYKDNFNKSLL